MNCAAGINLSKVCDGGCVCVMAEDVCVRCVCEDCVCVCV